MNSTRSTLSRKTRSRPAAPKPPLFPALAALLAVLLSGCAGGNPGHGALEVRLWDHREAIGDFRHVRLAITAVRVHPAGRPRAEGWVEFEPDLAEIDLTQYVGGPQAVILRAPARAGLYDAVHLRVESVQAGLKDGRPAEIALHLDPLRLDFQIAPGETTALGLDLSVLDLSDHPGGGYELHLREALVIVDG